MKTRLSLPLALWIAAAALAAAALAAFRGAPAPADDAPSASRAAPPASAPSADRGRLRADAALLRDRDPFRLDRAPAAQRYGAPPVLIMPTPTETAPQPMPAPTPVQAPALSVSGIVGGPPWQAVIENLPGAGRGVLLGVGEEAGGVRVLWIRGDSVAVSSAEKTSVLVLKQP